MVMGFYFIFSGAEAAGVAVTMPLTKMATGNWVAAIFLSVDILPVHVNANMIFVFVFYFLT